MDFRFLLLGAVLPDIIDKVLGHVVLAGTLDNGRLIGHTLLFAVILMMIGLALTADRITVMGSACGAHLVLDMMWYYPATLLWPAYGWSFPVEDFEVYDKRRQEIEAEFQRLEEQRQHLLEVVDELISKKKAGLMQVFDHVNVNFETIYKELSLGGEGHLELEDPVNPFEGGLMIVAKPPGKRVKKLVQLSGGEKSLTALALIFAIQKYDPSPFYLLDEVDMFLDAVNAERVAKLVSGTSERAQFITITLRKVTMGHADHAYGVTMGEKGISELIGNVHISQVGEKGEIVKSERPVEEPVGGDAVA